MNKSTTNRRSIAVVGLLLLGYLLLLAGCASSSGALPTSTVPVATETDASATVAASSTPVPTEPAASPTEEAATPTATAMPSETAVPPTSTTTPIVEATLTESPTSAPVTNTPQPTPIPPTATIVVATATPDEAETTGQPEVVLRYQRTGGIAGVNQEWTVYSDGTIVGNDGTTKQASVEEVVRLLTDIEELGFYDMAPRYGDPRACCDMFTYVISVRGSSRQHSVTTVDAADDAPAELMDVLSRVSHFVMGE